MIPGNSVQCKGNKTLFLTQADLCFSVVNHLLQYFYKYTSTILDDAQKVSSHSRKEIIDEDDIKFAVKVIVIFSIITTPRAFQLLDRPFDYIYSFFIA